MLIKSKSKSFDLISEEKATKPQQPERLYQPRRMSWLKYIVIPTGIGFILLLILCNVDFSVNQQEGLDDNNTTNSIDIGVHNHWSDQRINLNDFYFDMQCLETEEIMLSIESYSFPNEIISKHFLIGDLRFDHLTIQNSLVKYIANGAFASLPDLKSLNLINLPINRLTVETFSGLSQLQNFTLISSRAMFKAKKFLKPFATIISSITIQLKNKLYNLDDIFGTTIEYTKLKVLDLKGTQISDLSENTFNKMPMLEYLNLAQCGLKSIDSIILNEVFDTLKYLDLSENNITTLSNSFILAIWKNNINLETFDTMETTQGIVPFTPGVRTTSSSTSTPAEETDPSTTPAPSPTPTLTTITQQSESTVTVTVTDTDTDTDTEEPSSTPTITSTTPSKSECPEDSIYCAEFVCSDQEYAIPYQVVLTFEDIATNGNMVKVTLSPFESGLNYHLIYFNNDMQSNSKAFETQTLQLDTLECATSYTFCVLIYENATDTSPFNCQSHRTLDCSDWILHLSWFQQYFVLIIGLGLVGILLSVILGIFVAYIILRLKPNWLRGSKRLIKPLRNSQTMFLLPRLTELANPHMTAKDYDYINYYRRLERAKRCEIGFHQDNMPPKDRAPSIPPSVTSSENTATTASSSYLYESFELYEELS